MVEELKQKILAYFEDLDFNSEAHVYTRRGRVLNSVSSAIKNFVIPFEKDKIAIFVAKKRGITKKEVLAEWEAKAFAACSKGNKAHLFGENYKEGIEPTDGYEEAIVSFWKNVPVHIVPVIFELKMFSDALGIAGTSDIILYNTLTGKFIIADYKTNEDLFKNYKEKKLLPPFNHLLDNAFNKYQLQLSLYQLLFEQIGFEVEARKLIWLKPNGIYQIFNTEDMTKTLLKELTK